MKCIKFQGELDPGGSPGSGSLVPGSTIFTYPKIQVDAFFCLFVDHYPTRDLQEFTY